MGRRLNVSTPTVINTELVPLDESFYLDVDGQMEQWYYDNTEQYAPNRKVTPLLLVPVISAFDKDTSTSYTPAFNTTQWFANEWNETQGKYVETEITNQVDSGSADYVIQGNNLLVKKNVSYSHAVSIRCVATYIDPRDSGVTYTVEDSVNLTTNRTADVVFPEVDIISPSGRAYNPLVDDENSQYDFKGVTTNNPVQPLNTDVRRYSVDVDGTEEILNSGEAVAPIMDIHYGDNPTLEDQEFMYRQTAGGTLVGESINKAYIERIKGNTVAWNQLNNYNEKMWKEYSYSTTISIKQTEGEILFRPQNLGTSKKCDLRCSIKNVGHCFYVNFVVAANPYAVLQVSYYENGVLVNDIDITQGETQFSSVIITQSTSNPFRFVATMSGEATSNDYVTIKKIVLIDITLIYGAGNEPTTPEQFEADYFKWFGKPLTYEPYNDGELIPVKMTSLKSVGFNLWDEQWVNGYVSSETGNVIENSTNTIASQNLIPVIHDATYYLRGKGYVTMYDANQAVVGQVRKNNDTFDVGTNVCYIRFHIDGYGRTYNHDICVNISNPSKNGTYEPYEEKVQGFDVTAIKGRLNGAGDSVTIFPDGLKKAGDVQDEIFVEDGVVKAIKRVGAVDMGTLTWTWYQNNMQFYAVVPNAKAGEWETECCCARYVKSPLSHNQNSLPHLRGFAAYAVYLIDDRFEGSTSALVASLQGVMLYYELGTPQTYVLDPITDFVWYGIENGQEVLADTLPWYVSGQGTDSLTVDAMYGENINVVLRCKMMDGETLSPSKAYATLSWRTPDIEPFVQSENGGAVRGDTEEMSFGTIVNVNGEVLSDALKQKHLAFNWKIHKDNAAPNTPEAEIDKGWGQRITIDASDLRNVRQTPSSTLASTLVYNHVYLKGAYEEVTDNGEVVTYNGEKVYDRPID